MFPQFAQAMSRLAGRTPVVIALSGGLDSVVLARLATAWLRENGNNARIVAAHVNHGLRGAASDNDAAFCRSLARELAVDFVELPADAAATARRENIGLEEAGRRIRYRFFSELAGADGVVLTGHHAGDQVETILLNLRRGAGRRGLAGMREYGDVAVPPAISVVVARPLLHIEKSALAALARGSGWNWREDATNVDTVFMRNRIRRRIVPALEKLVPGFSQRLLQRAEAMRVEDERLAARAKPFGKREHGGVFLKLGDEAFTDAELFTYILRNIIEAETGRRLSQRQTIAGICRLADSGRLNETIVLPGALHVRRERDGLFFFREKVAAEEVVFPEPPFNIRFAGLAITAEWMPDGAIMPEADMRDDSVQWLHRDALRPPLRLRPPEQGERFRALGAPGGRKIHDLLVDMKVPRRERGFPRIVADAEGALWVWPLRLAERARLPDAKGPALRLQIQRTDK